MTDETQTEQPFTLDDISLTEEEKREMLEKTQLPGGVDYRFLTSGAVREDGTIKVKCTVMADANDENSTVGKHFSIHRLRVDLRHMDKTDRDFAVGGWRSFLWACGIPAKPDLPRKNPASGKYEVDGEIVTDYDRAKADNVDAVVAAMVTYATNPSLLNGLAPCAQATYNDHFLNLKKFKPIEKSTGIGQVP